MDVTLNAARTMRIFVVVAVLLATANALFESCSDWLTSNETLTLDSPTTTLEVGITRITWWEASQNGCNRKRNTRDGVTSLFWRIGDEFSPLITHLLMLSGSGQFWTGGLVVNTPWTWTDGQPVYRYLGTGSISGKLTAFMTIRENDAFHCHDSCRNSSSLSMVALQVSMVALQVSMVALQVSMVALQGDQCFCVDNATLTSMTDPDFPCTGTYMEPCGTRNKVSLYNIELPMGMTWMVNRPEVLLQGLCAYVSASMPNGTVDLVPATDCSRPMMYICQFDFPSVNSSCHEMFCPYNESASWDEAQADCKGRGGNLAAPNDSSMADFRLALISSQPYWVGLSRAAELRTINGSVEQSVNQTELQLDGYCQILNVTTSNGLSTGLVPCNSNLIPLYIKDTPGVTRMPLPSTTSTTPTSTTMTTTTMTSTMTSSMTSTMMSTMMTTMRSTPGPRQETTPSNNTDSQAQQPSNGPAAIAGSLIAGVIVLCVLLFAVAYMKRERLLCFKSRQPGEQKLREDFNPEARYHSGANGATMAEAGFNLEREEGIDLDSPVGPGPAIPEIHVTEASAAGETTLLTSAPADAQGKSTDAAKPASETASTPEREESRQKQDDAGDEAAGDRPASSSGPTDQPTSGEPVSGDSDEKSGEKSEGDGSAENKNDDAGAPEASGENGNENKDNEAVLKTDL